MENISVTAEQSFLPIFLIIIQNTVNISQEKFSIAKMLNQWFFAVHFIIILIYKKKNNLIDCSAFLRNLSTKKVYVLRDQKCIIVAYVLLWEIVMNAPNMNEISMFKNTHKEKLSPSFWLNRINNIFSETFFIRHRCVFKILSDS